MFCWAQIGGNRSKGVREGHKTILRLLATPKAQIDSETQQDVSLFTLAKNGQISLQRPPRPATPRLFRWAQSYGNLSKGVWEGHRTIVRALAAPKAQIHPQQHITINTHILKFQRTGSTGLLLLVFLGVETRADEGGQRHSRATTSSSGGSDFASDHVWYRVTCGRSHPANARVCSTRDILLV